MKGLERERVKGIERERVKGRGIEREIESLCVKTLKGLQEKVT